MMITPRLHPLVGKRAAFYTLGCRLNYAETSTIARQLATVGVERISDEHHHTTEVLPDICIVNSCSVTDTADKKCRSLINRLHREYPEALIVVTGCYAQLQGDQIAQMPGVDLVVGSGRKSEIVALLTELCQKRTQPKAATPHVTARRELQHFEPSVSSDDRTRHFLKVQDGCNYYCTYCTIPAARGVSRNGSIASLVAQAERVAELGGREIILTGVNIGDFGRTTGETLLELLHRLTQVAGIARYRIGSIEPELLPPEIIQFVAETEQFMPHFHIPLQSGSDQVLRLMRRHSDTALFAERPTPRRWLSSKRNRGASCTFSLIASAKAPKLWRLSPLCPQPKRSSARRSSSPSLASGTTLSALPSLAPSAPSSGRKHATAR